MNGQAELAPRWGAFSVISHLSRSTLTPEILLYDKLIFPVPTEEDWERWKDNRWKPELVNDRLDELGQLALPVRWDEDLRANWAVRWDRFKQLGKDVQGVAIGLTPMVLAYDVVQKAMLSSPSNSAPIVIAAYQSPTAAYADTDLSTKDVGNMTVEELSRVLAVEQRRRQSQAQSELHRAVHGLFARRLHMPLVEYSSESYTAYGKAIKLAHDKTFQLARRNLFEWEDQVVPKVVSGQWSIETAIEELERHVENHNDLIRTGYRKTWIRRSYHVADVVLPTLVGLATTGLGLATVALSAIAAAGILKLVEARLPTISNPHASPGAALSQAIGVMSHDALKNRKA